MPKPLGKLAESVFADALAPFGVPTSTAATVFQEFMKRRGDEARDILFEEISSGQIDTLEAASDDDAIGVIYRYFLAARDNAARLNLRLLAKVIVGQVRRDRLYADEFNKYAELLARLSRDEVFVVGRYYALAVEEEATEKDRELARSNAWKRMLAELVPNDFPSEIHVKGICTQAMGHGLIVAQSVWGGLAYSLSPLMDEIAELVDFEHALRAESKRADE